MEGLKGNPSRVENLRLKNKNNGNRKHNNTTLGQKPSLGIVVNGIQQITEIHTSIP